ncbi:TatA Sec-independent protein secretion pathway components [Rhabdaerophilaceae bacterium]
MFDISWGEFLVVGVVALIVIGPKELPGVIRSVGRGMAKLRAMASDFRSQFDDAMREAELHEVQKEFNDLKNQATGLSTATFDPIRKEVQSALESAKAAASGEPVPPAAPADPGASETLASIEADARAMEAEMKANGTDPVTSAPIDAGNAAEILPSDPVSSPKPPTAKTGDAA